MNTELHPYQREALSHLQQRLEGGWRRLYIELPTGTGKSTIAAAFAEQRQALGRILALVHRQDLAQQLANTFRREGLEVGLLMEGTRTLHSPVVVATVQSLTSEATQDLLAASPVPIRTVLIDEAHHAIPGSDYERILTDIEHAAGEQLIVTVGMTATPYRTDERSMLDLLPTCAFARTIPEMVREGYLAPLTWQPVQIDLNLDEVATTRQNSELDYAETTLARHLLNETITARIVGYAASRIGQRPTLVFAVTVQHAQQLSEAFRARGYTTAVVSGGTSRKRRENIFAGWRAGAIQVICNCALLTEGFDYPEVAAVVIARPTLSPVLYMQMLGRGMRKAEGKIDCLVIDVVGNQPDPRRQVVLPHVIGIQEQPEDEQHREQQAGRRRANRLLRFVLRGQGKTELALLDPLGRSHYRWNDFSGGYFATINDHTIAILDHDPAKSGLYRSRLYTQPPGHAADHHWVEERLLPLRQQIALLHEATRSISYERLAGKEAPWLNKPASEKQLKKLGRYDKRLPEWARTADWTQRDASAAITYYQWRWVLLHPPPLRKNRRTKDETLTRG
jgi:superfamily II DNA or RNA helicase